MERDERWCDFLSRHTVGMANWTSADLETMLEDIQEYFHVDLPVKKEITYSQFQASLDYMARTALALWRLLPSKNEIDPSQINYVMGNLLATIEWLNEK